MQKKTRDKTLPRITPEQLKNVREWAASGLTMEQVCTLLKINRQYFANISKLYPAVRLEYDEGKADAVRRVGNQVFKKAANGNMDAAKFWLEAQAKWSRVHKITVTDENLKLAQFRDMKIEDVKEQMSELLSELEAMTNE